MSTREARLSGEEVERRGRDLYTKQILPQVEAGNKGKIVAIDVESGEYAVADTGLVAAHQLLDKNSDAQIWCERIGFPAVHELRSPRRVK